MPAHTAVHAIEHAPPKDQVELYEFYRTLSEALARPVRRASSVTDVPATQAKSSAAPPSKDTRVEVERNLGLDHVQERTQAYVDFVLTDTVLFNYWLDNELPLKPQRGITTTPLTTPPTPPACEDSPFTDTCASAQAVEQPLHSIAHALKEVAHAASITGTGRVLV